MSPGQQPLSLSRTSFRQTSWSDNLMRCLCHRKSGPSPWPTDKSRPSSTHSLPHLMLRQLQPNVTAFISSPSCFNSRTGIGAPGSGGSMRLDGRMMRCVGFTSLIWTPFSSEMTFQTRLFLESVTSTTNPFSVSRTTKTEYQQIPDRQTLHLGRTDRQSMLPDNPIV